MTDYTIDDLPLDILLEIVGDDDRLYLKLFTVYPKFARLVTPSNRRPHIHYRICRSRAIHGWEFNRHTPDDEY